MSTRSRDRTGMGKAHWFLRPARLPIPPSGHTFFRGAKIANLFVIHKRIALLIFEIIINTRALLIIIGFFLLVFVVKVRMKI